MKYILYICFLVLAESFLFSQENTLSGYVIDKSNNAPLPYVLVQLEGKSIGANTNEDGFFSFTASGLSEDQKVVISFLGYKEKNILAEELISNPELKIYIEAQTFDLAEIIVKPIDPVQLVKQAVVKISENYPVQPVYLDGYYRELIKEDTTFIKLADASFTFYLSSYTDKWNRNDQDKKYNSEPYFFPTTRILPLHEHWNLYAGPNDQLKIIEARASDNLSVEKINPSIMGGPLKMLGSDIVKQHSFLWFLMPDKMKNYIYKLEKIIPYNNRTVYVIAFENKKEVVTKGRLFIDAETLAFVSISFDMDARNCHWGVEKHIKFSAAVDYSYYAGKWYLSQIKKENVYSIKPDFTGVSTSLSERQVTYSTQTQLFINNIRTENVKKFNETEIYRSAANTFMSNERFTYNKNFWENYNCSNCLILEQKVLRDMQRSKTLEQQFIK